MIAPLISLPHAEAIVTSARIALQSAGHAACKLDPRSHEILCRDLDRVADLHAAEADRQSADARLRAEREAGR